MLIVAIVVKYNQNF